MTITFQVTCFMGNARAGKTLSMVSEGFNIWLEIQFALKDLMDKKRLSSTEKKRLKILKGFEIWSNLKLNKRIFGEYTQINMDTILDIYNEKLDISNKLLLIDDIFKDIDSRNSPTKKNKAFGYFLKEIGKKHNILLYVSHFDTDVEIRLRHLTDFFVLCKKGSTQQILLNTGEILEVWREDENYYNWKNEIELKKMIIYQQYFKKFIDFDNDFIVSRELHEEKMLYAFKFFNMYDTGEIV